MIVRELVTLLGFQVDDAPQVRYDKQIDATKEKTNALATATKGIGLAWKIAAAAVGIGVGWISKNILSGAAQMENYRRQLETFTGSAEAAAETLENLRNSTVGQLFDTGSLVAAHNQLRLVGLSAETTGNMIDALGDIANGSVGNFNALSNVLVRISAEGKVNERSLRQLAQAGFGVQDMAEGLGMSEQHLLAMVNAGRIGFDDLTRSMQAATSYGGRFYQNAARQAQTLSGSIQILRNTIFDIGEAIGTSVLPRVVDMINRLTSMINLGKNGLVNFGSRAFDRLISTLAEVYLFFRILEIRMRRFGGAFTPFKALFASFTIFIRQVSNSAKPMLLNLAQLILVAFRPIQAFISPSIVALGAVIQRVFGFVSNIFERLIPLIYGITPIFERMGTVIGSLIIPLLAVALAIRGINTAIAIKKSLVATVNKMRTAFALLTGTMSIMKAAAEGNRFAMLMMDAQMLKSKLTAKAVAAALKIKTVALKAASVAQTILNAVMKANPIGLIIVGVMALIAAIVLLVRNWDRVVEAFGRGLEAIGNFFTGLWNTFKQGGGEAIEFIRSAFFGIFDSIKNKFFGFINVIRNGWETVRGFFSNVAGGVVDFVSGNRGSNRTGSQPAYAGAGTYQGSLTDNALSRAVSNSYYNSSNASNMTTLNAPISVNVEAGGMSPTEVQTVVQRGVQDALTEAINGCRGNIPSPEARRY